MKLTDGEKLIILMLSEMYEALKIKGETDPDFLRSAIFNDQLWAIRWKYAGIPFDSSDDPPILREVLDILDMWSLVEFSYSQLDNEDKNKLAQDAAPFGTNPSFMGFDGNHETEYMSVARFLVDQLDRFQEFKGRSFNCHYPSLDAHRRMIAIFEPIRASLEDSTLSLEQLTIILNARTHPQSK